MAYLIKELKDTDKPKAIDKVFTNFIR